MIQFHTGIYTGVYYHQLRKLLVTLYISAWCFKEHKSVHGFSFAGNQQTTPAPSNNRAEASSPESDREENQSPSIEDGNNTANTFKGDPPGEQTKTSVVNEDAEN